MNSVPEGRRERLIYLVASDHGEALALAAQVGYFGYSVQMGIPFLPPTSGDRLRGWTTAGTQSRVSITPGRFRKWMNGFVPTRHVEITFGTFGGRTGSSVLIAAWSRSHGKWREDGYGVVHAAAKPH